MPRINIELGPLYAEVAKRATAEGLSLAEFCRRAIADGCSVPVPSVKVGNPNFGKLNHNSAEDARTA